jgi:abortive infection bacteriophage resistance protein
VTLVQKLQADGLSVANLQDASAFIDRNNYYRFKVYLRPFLTSPTAKSFAPGSRFEDALELHNFDEELRSFILGLTSAVELQLRHKLDQRLTIYGSDSFWYLRTNYYRHFPAQTLRMARHTLERSREEFALHYLNKYHSGVGGEFNFLPPFWIVSELLTIGQLDYLIRGFEKSAFDNPAPLPNELDLLARDFGAYNIGHLQKWVEYVRNIRNWCSHHSRLWNRHMATPPNVERSLSRSVRAASKHRLYHSLAMLRIMMRSRGINDDIKSTMMLLFAKYPIADANKDKMGFPANWQTDSFW